MWADIVGPGALAVLRVGPTPLTPRRCRSRHFMRAWTRPSRAAQRRSE